MYLIMNADDFGYTKAVTDGIVYCYEHGIIRSTTAMCNMPAIEYAGELKKKYPGLGLGLHLTISCGSPILKTHKTLVNENGDFYPKSSILREKKDIDPEEVMAEFEAQLAKFIEVFGCMPDHIDGHHSSAYIDHILPVTLEFAKKHGFKMRRYTGDVKYEKSFYKDTVNVEYFKEVMDKYLAEGTYGVEVGCHPGFCDYDLYKTSSYNVQRLNEVDLWCNPEVIKYLEEKNIELANYSIVK